MSNAYLNIAETILERVRRPLSPREMLQLSHALELVPWHLHGATQHKTLHARLSEDISRHLEGSRFYRTSPGRFYLRSLRRDPNTPEQFQDEYFAPPRRKELRRDAILVTTPDILSHSRPDEPVIPSEALQSHLDHGSFAFLPWQDILKSTSWVPINSFLIVYRGDEILSYRCGKFHPDSDPIYGQRSIGLGGAVFGGDVDILFDSYHGIIGSGINDLAYGIGLPRRLAERARYDNQVDRRYGVYSRAEKTGHMYLHAVLLYQCPDEFIPARGALSVNDLRWIRIDEAPNALEDYDATSQYLLGGARLRQLISGD